MFNSASEFLESVEDTRDSVWLVHIVMRDEEHTSSCSKSRFVSSLTWSRLNKLSKFGILTGTFNCERDRYFCQMKGWHKPQLVLGLVKFDMYRSPKEFVELYTYDDCKRNKYENVFSWLDQMLSSRVNKNFQLGPNENEEKFDLKVFYLKNSTSSKLPMYYSAMSVKYNRRAMFYSLEKSDFFREKFLVKKCFNFDLNSDYEKMFLLQKSPIYILIDDKYCYNYGTHLNELPNFVYLNQFLLFFSPDMNSIFMISFFFLNTFLILIFFEYNQSILKQIAIGLIYFCIFNFFLLSIWLLTINSSSITELASVLNFNIFFKVISWLRVFIISNRIMQNFFAFSRFFLFFYIFVRPSFAFFIFIFLSILFYLHTKRIFTKTVNNLLPLKHNQGISLIVPSQEQELNANLSSERDTNTITINSASNQDIDIEISVSEIINQINGMTTIWLQSSSYADRLISELPTIEYCKCFYVNTVKMHAKDETDREETSEEDGENEETKKMIDRCDCGKNTDLNYLDKNNLKSLYNRFHRECSICLDKYSFGNFIISLPCGHLFHKKCIYEWFMNSVNYKCPVCRTSFYRFKKCI